jgi:hypothetical protein
MKLGQDCYIVRDHDGQDIAKLPELLRRAPACALGETNEISSRDIALTQGPRAGEGK